MERHNQKADQLPVVDPLASLVIEDAIPFGSSSPQAYQETRVIPAQQTSSLVPRAAVAMPSRIQPPTGMSSSLPSQARRLQESERTFPVPQRAFGDSLSLQEDVLKQVSPKAVEAAIKPLPAPSFSSLPPMSGSFSDLPSLKKSTSFQDVSDEDIEHYRDQFPGELKSDVHDAMIIYQDDDLNDVLQFLSRVDSDVRLNSVEKPKVVLYTDVRPDITTPIGQLDMSLPQCTYIFLYVTKKFCADGWTEFSSQTCLMEAIYNTDKKWSVVPIFTESRRNTTYKIPASIRSLKGIQYWSEDKFYADSLRKLLEEKLHVRKSKEVELKHKRKLWIMKKKAEEIREADRREQEKEHALAEERRRQEMYEQAKKEKELQHTYKMQLPDLSELRQLYRDTRAEEGRKYIDCLSHYFPGMPPFYTVPARLDSFGDIWSDPSPVFHPSMSTPQTSAMHTPHFPYLQEGMLLPGERDPEMQASINSQNLSSNARFLDSGLAPSTVALDSKTGAEPHAGFSVPSSLSSSGPGFCPAPVSFSLGPSADLSSTSATMSSGSGSRSGNHAGFDPNPETFLDFGRESQKVSRLDCRYFDLAVPRPCETEAGSENLDVPPRSGGSSRDPMLPVAVDRTQLEEGASSSPSGLERLSESRDIEEDLPPASRTFSTSKQAEGQRFQQCRAEVRDRRVPITNVGSVPVGQGLGQGPDFSCLPSQLPGNRIGGLMYPFMQHGNDLSYVRPQSDHLSGHRRPPRAGYPLGVEYPTARGPVPGSFNPPLHLGQQHLYPEGPVREVHHHYYPDPSYSHLPPTINIKNAENIMIGEKIHITHRGDGHERHKEHQQTQESPTDQSSTRDILETAEQPFQQPGQSEPPELDPRGPSLGGSSLDSLPLNTPSSGLTGQVTADQSRSQSLMPSPDLPKQPSRKNPQYGFPDLISTPNTGGGSSKYPPPSPDESTPGVLVRPVAVTKPFNPAAEEQQWRRQYDAEHETAVKRLSGCGEETREDLSDNDGENHSTNAETMVKLRTP